MPATVRAFIAIHLPDTERATLAGLQAQFRSAFTDQNISCTKPAQIHLTLKFLGNVPVDSLENLKHAIASVSASATPLTLSIDGLGAFPDLKRPRVLWAGVGGELTSLRGLQKSLDLKTRAWCAPEERAFHPHLTLARIKLFDSRNAAALTQSIQKHAIQRFRNWRATEICLMESKLASAGAEHFPLANFPLRGQCCAS